MSQAAQAKDVAARKKNTHCSEGCQCISCLNMPTIEGPEYLVDLGEIALEEEVTDFIPLDTDTNELIDWVFGVEMEDNASVEEEEEAKSSVEDL